MNDTGSDSLNSDNNAESSSHTSSPNEAQKKEISHWVAEGMGLSDIQRKINDDFGIVMTYMDVRFLVDDLDLTLVDEEQEVADDTSQSSNPSELIKRYENLIELENTIPTGQQSE